MRETEKESKREREGEGEKEGGKRERVWWVDIDLLPVKEVKEAGERSL